MEPGPGNAIQVDRVTGHGLCLCYVVRLSCQRIKGSERQRLAFERAMMVFGMRIAILRLYRESSGPVISWPG